MVVRGGGAWGTSTASARRSGNVGARVSSAGSSACSVRSSVTNLPALKITASAVSERPACEHAARHVVMEDHLTVFVAPVPPDAGIAIANGGLVAFNHLQTELFLMDQQTCD